MTSDPGSKRARDRANELADAARESRLWAHERIGALTAVVFGLSFLALQVKEPDGEWFIIGSWIALGLAVLVTAITGTIEWIRRERTLELARVTAMAMARGERSGPDPVMERFGGRPVLLWWLHGLVLFAFTAGVALLITFAICNVR